MRRAGIIALVILGVAASGASALERSPFPKPRPQLEQSTPKISRYRPPVFGPSANTPRPKPRPGAVAAPAVAPQAAAPVQVARGTVLRSPLPRPRPPRQVVQAAVVQSQPATVTSSGKVGKICGDRKIQGRKIAPIPGKLSGCGVQSPVEVFSIDGVALSTPSKMECDTAKALKTWINDGVKPTVKRLGGGVASLQIAGHYVCRTRNHKPGGKISEHGKGKAIDISAINLKNGSSISVLKHWNTKAEGKLLKTMHAKACGPFGTVLGPDADKYHKDHFHFDTASYRSGSYCR